MVTVQQLIDVLHEIGGKVGYDAPVITQKDSEGNGYSPLAGADSGFYLAETTWYGEFYNDDPDLDEEDRAPEEAVKAAILWPIN